jgi:hypothetical protein
MVAMAYTVAFGGIDARLLQVQCAISPGLLGFSIVGLPDKAVSEARERVRAALTSMAIALPSQRISTNLSPADMPKEGSPFNLPIALAVLAALDVVPHEEVSDLVALGELSLGWYAGPGCWRTARRCGRGRGRSVPDVPCLVRGRGCLGRQRSRHRACDTGVGDRASDRPRGS